MEPPVAPGRYSIRLAGGQSYAEQTVEFEIVAGERTSLEVVMQPKDDRAD